MRALQELNLHSSVQNNSPELVWYDTLNEVPRSRDTYTMLVAHEFFDALPVHVIEVCLVDYSHVESTIY